MAVFGCTTGYVQFVRPQIVGSIDVSGRRSRSDYAIGVMVTALELCIVPFAFIYLGGRRMDPAEADQVLFFTQLGSVTHAEFLILFSFGVVAIFATINYIALTAQRLHDLGASAWVAVLIAIPVVGWFLAAAIFFLQGDSGENRFGGNPRKLPIARVKE